MKYLLIFILLFLSQWASAQNCTGPHSSTNANDSWLSCDKSQNPNSARADSHWALFDLGADYTLGTSYFWNFNNDSETENGIKNLVIDYSLNGTTWTELGIMELQEASGTIDYLGEGGLDFDGIMCRYVLITVLETWGGQCAGISEVRFDINQTSVSLRDVYADNASIELFPNPTQGFFTIEGELLNYDITIMDASGNIFMTLTGENSPITIDISNLPDGLYFVSISHVSNYALCLKTIIKS